MSNEQTKQTAVAPIAEKRASTLSVIKGFVGSDEIKKRFSEVLGAKAATFLGSIVSVVSSNTNFRDVDPNTIMSSALVAATMDLPINPNLGFAHIIPYSGRAQFQMGYKGYIQLGLRTGQYKTLNVTEIYDGELISRNRLTGEVVIDEAKRKSDEVIGYASYFKLLNGFEKTLYMTTEEVKAHGKKYSKSFSKANAPWQTDFDGMAKKTLIKLLLSKYGILSVEMQRALEVDQAVIKNDGKEIEYVDNGNSADKVEDAVLEVESSGVVEKTAETPTAQPAPEEVKAAEEVDEKPKHKTEQQIFTEIMDGLGEIETAEMLSGWKSLNNDLLQKLSPLKYDMIVNLIAEKEQSFSKKPEAKPAPAVNPVREEYLKKIAATKLKSTLRQMTPKVVADLNDKKITKNDRDEIIQAIADRMEALDKK